MSSLVEMIKRHEGVKSKVYLCSAGYETIGVGRNISESGLGLSDDEIEYLQLNQDLDLKLFVDGPKPDSNALNPMDLKDNKEIDDLIGKIEYKIEEINELFKKLRGFVGK